MILHNIYIISHAISMFQYIDQMFREKAKYMILLTKVDKEITDDLLSRTESTLKVVAKYCKENGYILDFIEDMENKAKEGKTVKKKISSLSLDEYKLVFLDYTKSLQESSFKWHEKLKIELMDSKIIVPFDGGLNTKKMLKGGEVFIGTDLWNLLSDISKSDLEDFINCYLLESWTAAGIMGLRIIESFVREYYMSFPNSKIKRENGQYKSLYTLLSELKDFPEVNIELIEKLQLIRKYVRNPLAHSEKLLNQHQAEEIYTQMKQVVSLLKKD